jgi:hypothetical protein
MPTQKNKKSLQAKAQRQKVIKRQTLPKKQRPITAPLRYGGELRM